MTSITATRTRVATQDPSQRSKLCLQQSPQTLQASHV